MGPRLRGDDIIVWPALTTATTGLVPPAGP